MDIRSSKTLTGRSNHPRCAMDQPNRLARTWQRWILCLSIVVPGIAGAETRPENMVYLRTIEPGIEQDIRYASAHNFTVARRNRRVGAR